MQLQRPFAALTPTVDGDVLGVLARADDEFSAATVHELAKYWSLAGVRKSLQRLVEQGLVLSRRPGYGVYYRLNRDHLLAPAVITIARAYDELVQRLRAELGGWEVRSVFAALFGSAVGELMRADSDIDLFVVRADSTEAENAVWQQQLADLAAKVTGWTGNDTRVLEYTTDDVRAGLARSERLLSDIAAHGVVLYGPTGYLRTRSHAQSTQQNETVHPRRSRRAAEQGETVLRSSEPHRRARRGR